MMLFQTLQTLPNNGFDFNSITSSNITCPTNFSAGTPVAGTGGPLSPHSFICNWGGGSFLPAGTTLSVTVEMG